MAASGQNNGYPDIFSFYDYKEYLRALFDYHKSVNPVFSHRYIVRKAGFRSPNALKIVIDGDKNLSIQGAQRFADAFGIKGKELQYFLTLVKFSLAESLEDREKYLEDLINFRQSEQTKQLDDRQYDVLSTWWNLAVKEMVALPDFKNSSKWVAKFLCPSIDQREAAASLHALKKLGFIAKDKKGNWKVMEKTLKSDPKVQSVKVAQFHREMIRLAGEAITRFPGSQREISGTTLRINKNDISKIKGHIRKFREKLLTLAANSEQADQVYQLNLQMFPLVRPERPVRLKEGMS